jgi:hypothetical protein
MDSISIRCIENSKEVIHTVKPLEVSTDSLKRLYEQMSKFPVIFGKPLAGPEDFLAIFMRYSRPSGDPSMNGLFWEIDDLQTGVFYLTDISLYEATVHFAFFDRRVKGREPLFHAMLHHAFDHFGFQRLNAFIPKYVKGRVHSFVRSCGIEFEGTKRSSAFYKGQWFDESCYGVLRDEAVWNRPIYNEIK